MGRHHKITLGDRCHGNPQLLIQVFIKTTCSPIQFSIPLFKFLFRPNSRSSRADPASLLLGISLLDRPADGRHNGAESLFTAD